MGSVFGAHAKQDPEKDELCDQCKDAWPDKKTLSDKFKREYTRFRDEAPERSGKTRGNGAAKEGARLLALLGLVRKRRAEAESAKSESPRRGEPVELPVLMLRR
jgi:hypothetical protein